MTTTTDQLASVREAISAVESGAQEARGPDGRMVKYPDIQVLYAREKDLMRREAREAAGGRISISRGAGS